MMTGVERDLGLEGRVGGDDDLELKAVARADRLLGAWGAGLMGLESPDDYADAVVRYAAAHADGDAILRKIAQDLAGAGLKFSEDQVRGKRDELLAISRGQLQAEG